MKNLIDSLISETESIARLDYLIRLVALNLIAKYLLLPLHPLLILIILPVYLILIFRLKQQRLRDAGFDTSSYKVLLWILSDFLIIPIFILLLTPSRLKQTQTVE